MPSKKTAFETMQSQVAGKLEESRKQAEKEMAKVKQNVAASLKKVDDYVRKNPGEATMISAGIGAAIGAAVALLVRGKRGGKKK